MQSILEASIASPSLVSQPNICLGVPSQLQRHLLPEVLKQAQEIAEKLEIKQFDRKTPQQGCSTSLRAMLDPNLAGQSNQVVIMKTLKLTIIYR
jgi:hypothetical protein